MNDVPLSPVPIKPQEDIRAYQREELLDLLRRMSRENTPLLVHGVERLTSEDATRILHKIRHGLGFSRRERVALSDAGFDVDLVFPHL